MIYSWVVYIACLSTMAVMWLWILFITKHIRQMRMITKEIRSELHSAMLAYSAVIDKMIEEIEKLKDKK
jgi:hypothetical protein